MKRVSSRRPQKHPFPPTSFLAALEILKLQRARGGSHCQPKRPLEKRVSQLHLFNGKEQVCFFPLGAVPITQADQVDGTGTLRGWVPWVPTAGIPPPGPSPALSQLLIQTDPGSALQLPA